MHETNPGAAESRALSNVEIAGLACVAAGVYQNAVHAAFLAALQARDIALDLHIDVDHGVTALDLLDAASHQARAALGDLRAVMAFGEAAIRTEPASAAPADVDVVSSAPCRCGTWQRAAPYLVNGGADR